MTAPAVSPLTKGDWHRILRNARAVPPGDPEYEDAQAVIAQAGEELALLDAAEAAKDARPSTGEKVAATALGGTQGVTFGFADDIAELLAPGSKAEGEAVRDKAPGYALAGDLAGSLLAPIPGVGGAGAAKQLTKGVGAAFRAGRAPLLNAIRTGMKAGAISTGLNAAGRNEGDLGERARAGAIGAATGAAFGGALPLGMEVIKQGVMATPILGRTIRGTADKLRKPSGQSTLGEVKRVMQEYGPELDIPTYIRRAQASGQAPRTGKPVRITPDEAASRARAAQVVQDQVASGLRGPRGGMRVGSKASAPEARYRDIATQVLRMSDEELRTQLANLRLLPDELNDATAELVEQELARRAQTVGQGALPRGSLP